MGFVTLADLLESGAAPALGIGDLSGRKRRRSFAPPPQPAAPVTSPGQNALWTATRTEIDALKSGVSDGKIEVYAAAAGTCPASFTSRTLKDGSAVCFRTTVPGRAIPPAPELLPPGAQLPVGPFPTGGGGGGGGGGPSGGGGGGGGPTEEVGGGSAPAEGEPTPEGGAPSPGGEPPEPPPKPGVPMIVPIGIAGLAIAGGVWWYMKRKKEAGLAVSPATAEPQAKGSGK